MGVGPRLTREMTLEGVFLSPTKRRPLPVSEAQARLEWAVSADFSLLTYWERDLASTASEPNQKNSLEAIRFLSGRVVSND